MTERSDDPVTCDHCHSSTHDKSGCPVLSIIGNITKLDKSYGYEYKHYDLPLYDTHCHLDYVFDRYNYHGVLLKEFRREFSFPANFKGCICSFSDETAYTSFSIWRELLEQENVWGTFGYHPHKADKYNDNIQGKMIEFLQHPKAVAVGECGLDYSVRNNIPTETQKETFTKHIEIAKAMEKPLVIHSREAEDDVYDMLCKYDMQDWFIQIHCFTGNHDQLLRFVNEFPNMFFGFTNLVSYPTASNARSAASTCPMDRMLLETDAPYFVPQSLRQSERFSHPGHVLFVAEAIADLRSYDVEYVLDQCRRNVRKLFKI